MKAVIALIAVLFFLHFVNPAFAARNLTISANRDSLFGDEEVIIVASASGFTSGETIYVKGAFYQDDCGSNCNYFGYTKNGGNWIKNGDSTLSQKSIQIDQWDGSIIVKSDFSDSGYNGEGGYKLKVGFYYLTSGGNPSSVNWSVNSLDINLNEPDPTPTNTPIPTSIPTNTPTPTPIPTSSPTNTPTPTKTPTPIPTLKPSISPTPKILPTDILGESTQSGQIVSPADFQPSNGNVLISNEAKSSSGNWFQKIFIVVGGIFLVACAILFFRFYIKNKKQDGN